MDHEDGYCDRCGAALGPTVQLTFDGLEVCDQCAANEPYQPHRASKPEARDDGR